MLPSSVKCEAIRAAESVVRRWKMGACKSFPVLKKPVVSWNNQNYRIENALLSCPFWIEGKCKRISFRILLTPEIEKRLQGKRGSMRITQKNAKWIAQIAVEDEVPLPVNGGVMGVDLGLKVPAVAVTGEGKTHFFGNGRRNKFVRRKFASCRKAMGIAKKPDAIKKNGNKEQRWMRDQDHKVSRELVNFAQQQGIGTIRLEKLSGIRWTARTSRKNERNLHSWSFYRLAEYIEYKAALVGICIEYVDPRYTSQNCPMCGVRNHAKDRTYTCKCGFRAHRDRVGAMNILNAPVVAAQGLPA